MILGSKSKYLPDFPSCTKPLSLILFFKVIFSNCKIWDLVSGGLSLSVKSLKSIYLTCVKTASYNIFSPPILHFNEVFGCFLYENTSLPL
jgi:hypothetical protein